MPDRPINIDTIMRRRKALRSDDIAPALERFKADHDEQEIRAEIETFRKAGRKWALTMASPGELRRLTAVTLNSDFTAHQFASAMMAAAYGARDADPEEFTRLNETLTGNRKRPCTAALAAFQTAAAAVLAEIERNLNR